MLNPRISVVIPVFNGERYLDAALQSVLAQTFSDFELLVVDDGSTDRTGEILRKYAADSRVRIIDAGHNGICKALNAGLAAARGEFVARLDCDDVMLPNRLERQLAFLNSHPEIAGAGSYYQIVDEQGQIRGTKEPPLCTVEQLQSYLASGGELIYPHPTMMIRSRIALEHGGYRPGFEKCEDVDLFLRIVESGNPLLIQPEYLTQFRYHSQSASALHTRHQYHLKQIIFGNYRRRARKQPEISIGEYFTALERRSPWMRPRAEAEIQAAVCMRRRDMALLRGRKIRATFLLLCAAILNLRATFRKIKRVSGLQSQSLAPMNQ